LARERCDDLEDRPTGRHQAFRHRQTAKRHQPQRIPAKTRATIIEALKANPNASQVAKQVGGVSLYNGLELRQAGGHRAYRGKSGRKSGKKGDVEGEAMATGA
jgi:hypothetical protein